MKHSIAHLYMLHTYMEVFSIRLSIAETKEFCRRKIKKFLQYVFFHSTTENVLIDFVGLEFGFKLFVFLLRFDGCKKKNFFAAKFGQKCVVLLLWENGNWLLLAVGTKHIASHSQCGGWTRHGRMGFVVVICVIVMERCIYAIHIHIE